MFEPQNTQGQLTGGLLPDTGWSTAGRLAEQQSVQAAPDSLASQRAVLWRRLL